MANYKCLNENCSLFENEIPEMSVRITIVDGKAYNPQNFCPECGSRRMYLREPGITTNIAGTNDQRNRMAKYF